MKKNNSPTRGDVDARVARRVLCIAYFFPPSGGAGVQRPLKFIKYLSTFGWHAHVLTVSDGCFFAEDASLNAEIPDSCIVTRTWSLEFERIAILRALRQQHSQALCEPQRAATRLGRAVSQVLRRGRALLLPDPQIGWVPIAYRQALEICRTQSIDAVWTTSAPYSCHLIGLLLKRRLGLPWIADFRDAWSDNPMGMLSHQRAHRWLERSVLTHADRVVGVTDAIVDYLAQRTQGPAHKYHVIANGYDADDFVRRAASPRRARAQASFVLTMTGSLYGKISAVPFYEALAQFFKTHPDARPQTQVRWVGQMDRQARHDNQRALQHLGIGSCITYVGYVSHREAIDELMAADVLLLLLFAGPGASQVMTGKVFEYLAAQKPILAMAEGTAAAALVTACQAGIVTHPQHVDAIAQALATLWVRRDQPWPLIPERAALLAPYHRRALTQRLAHLLDSVVC